MEYIVVVIVVLAVGGLVYRAKNKPKSTGVSVGSKEPKNPNNTHQN